MSKYTTNSLFGTEDQAWGETNMASLVFSVDSALLNELGEKLVETVHVALIELVKNTYDADASSAERKAAYKTAETQV